MSKGASATSKIFFVYTPHPLKHTFLRASHVVTFWSRMRIKSTTFSCFLRPQDLQVVSMLQHTFFRIKPSVTKTMILTSIKGSGIINIGCQLPNKTVWLCNGTIQNIMLEKKAETWWKLVCLRLKYCKWSGSAHSKLDFWVMVNLTFPPGINRINNV